MHWKSHLRRRRRRRLRISLARSYIMWCRFKAHCAYVLNEVKGCDLNTRRITNKSKIKINGITQYLCTVDCTKHTRAHTNMYNTHQLSTVWGYSRKCFCLKWSLVNNHSLNRFWHMSWTVLMVILETSGISCMVNTQNIRQENRNKFLANFSSLPSILSGCE